MLVSCVALNHHQIIAVSAAIVLTQRRYRQSLSVDGKLEL